MRAAAVDEALVVPLNHWLTQTGKSIGPEGTRSLQARQSITWPELHTAKTHGFNGVCGDFECIAAHLHRRAHVLLKKKISKNA